MSLRMSDFMNKKKQFNNIKNKMYFHFMYNSADLKNLKP